MEISFSYYSETLLLDAAIQRSPITLEVLLLDFDRAPARFTEIISLPKILPHASWLFVFSSLTRLDLFFLDLSAA